MALLYENLLRRTKHIIAAMAAPKMANEHFQFHSKNTGLHVARIVLRDMQSRVQLTSRRIVLGNRVFRQLKDVDHDRSPINIVADKT